MRSGNIDGEDGVKDVWKVWVKILGWANSSLVDQRALGSDSEWIKNEESVVSQPGKDAWVATSKGNGEVAVTHNLGDGVGEKHGAEGWVLGELWEWVDNSPGEKKAGGDLHNGGHDWSANDA